jgi:integrase
VGKKLGMGTVYPRGRRWWIEFYFRGRLIRESSRSTEREDAERFLKRRMGEIAAGTFKGLAPERIKIENLLADVLEDYALHERKSASQLRSRLKHLQKLGRTRAADFNTEHVRGYIRERQKQQASNTTINRELQVVKRALSLALQCDPPKIARAPHIRLLPEDNVRTGFIDDKQYINLRDELPDYLKPLFVVAYHLGNRLGELRHLHWNQVDLNRNQIRLDPTQTKNKKGRVLPIYGEMRHWLIMQKAIRDAKFPGCPLVFHRGGKLIVDFRKAWRAATQRAGLSNTVFHDLRRSAIRNMREAGIPENLAMAISGHKTRSVFERYNIISDRDIKQAAEKMEQRFKQSLKTIREQEKAALPKRLQ